MEGVDLTDAVIAVELIGFADPTGLAVGFLVPIFQHPQRNSRLIQVVDKAGCIVEFEPCDPPDVEITHELSVTIYLHQPAVWGFAYGEVFIRSVDDSALRDLTGLLETALDAHPFTAMEVAEFLSLPKERDRFAKLAFDRLAEASIRTAQAWRDLSVLTMDLRELLRLRLGPAVRWPQHIFAVMMGHSTVGIYGLREKQNSVAHKALRTAVREAIRVMPLLYDGRLGNVRLAFPDLSPEADRSFVARLVVNRSFDVDRMNWDLRRAGMRQIELVGWDAEGAFAGTQLPTIALVDFSDDDIQGEIGRLPTRSISSVIIHGGTSPGSVTEHAPEWASRLPSFGVPNRSANYGREARKRADRSTPQVTGIRIAVTLTLEMLAGRFPVERSHRIIESASGDKVGGDPTGTLQIYDWLQAMSQAHREAVWILRSNQQSIMEISDPVTDVLFPDVASIGCDAVFEGLTDEKSLAVILVRPTVPTPDDDAAHHGKMVHLLSLLGWTVGTRRTFSVGFQIDGSLGRYLVTTDVPATREEMRSRSQRRFRFSRVRTIRIAPNVSTMLIVQHLVLTGRLLARVSDLALFDGRDATPWLIVALQLRRFVALRPDKFRTYYMHALFRDAKIAPGVEKRLGQSTDAVTKGRSAASDFHYLLEAVSIKDGIFVGVIALLPAVKGKTSSSIEPIRFVLQISALGPAVHIYRESIEGSQD